MIKGILIFINLLLLFLPVEILTADKPFIQSVKINNIIVEKSKRKLYIYSDYTLIKSYSVSPGTNPVGAKRFEGDEKMPEGTYFINSKNSKSNFYKSLGISYPNQQNINYAKMKGKKPCGNIKIHGLMNGMGLSRKIHLFKDWTEGCIAVTNKEMDELYEIISIGTPIDIKP